MSKSLFTIDSSEKQRILEMHQSATRKQYLGEQSTTAPVANTSTTTPVPATTSPSMAPMVTSLITLGNQDKVQVLYNNSPINFKIEFKPQVGAKNVVIPGVYSITVRPELKSLSNVIYKFEYNCGSKSLTHLSTVNYFTESNINLDQITVRYNNRDYKNTTQSYTVGFEKKTMNPALSSLRQLADSKLEWNISNFGDLTRLCS